MPLPLPLPEPLPLPFPPPATECGPLKAVPCHWLEGWDQSPQYPFDAEDM